MTTRKNSRFQKGTGCYKCDSCGRLARATGVQSLGAKTCEDCYELAGIENAIADGDGTFEKYAAEINRRVAHIKDRGGDADAAFPAWVVACANWRRWHLGLPEGWLVQRRVSVQSQRRWWLRPRGP